MMRPAAGCLGLAIVLATACVARSAAALPLPSPSVARARSQATDFQQGWVRLRAAILRRDVRAVANFAVFPLPVHGITDDEIGHVTRAGFPVAFEKMLKEGDGGGARTNFEQIRDTPRLNDPGAGFTAPVGGMELKRSAAGLRIVRIYVDTE